MKIKLFTHTDLDGYGCKLLADIAFGDSNVDAEFCGYANINYKIKKFLSSEKCNEYAFMFITDISVDEEVAELINKHNELFCNDLSKLYIHLVDHHPTSEWLGSKYDWAEISTVIGDDKVCGTSLFYDLLIEYDLLSERNPDFNTHILKEFVELVRRYDTWEWKEKYNDFLARDLNELFKIYGEDRFINNFKTKIVYGNDLFSSTDEYLLEIEQEKVIKYIDRLERKLKVYEVVFNGKYHKFGVVFADDHISILGNTLCERNKSLDFVMIISGMSTISFRTIRDDIDLGKDIASLFGGGGHPKTAGAQISNEFRKKIINNILGIEDEYKPSNK